MKRYLHQQMKTLHITYLKKEIYYKIKILNL
jgi:hypothetical protein